MTITVMIVSVARRSIRMMSEFVIVSPVLTLVSEIS